MLLGPAMRSFLELQKTKNPESKNLGTNNPSTFSFKYLQVSSTLWDQHGLQFSKVLGKLFGNSDGRSEHRKTQELTMI
jgi:hypothetical protein